MPIQAQTWERFGGLNLISEPEEIGTSAVDLIDVDVTHPGRIRTRDGYQSYTTITGAGAMVVDFISGIPGGIILVSYTEAGTSKTSLFDSSGVLITNASIKTQSVAVWRSPSAQVVYFCGNGTTAIRKFDGASITAPAGMPSPRYVTTWQNRLVAIGNASGLPRVQFSNAGAPETWGASDFVDLPYGSVIGAATLGNNLYVVCETAVVVFFSTSVDGLGGALFNNRAVPLVGPPPFSGTVTPKPNGVFFAANDGIYATTGGDVTKISRLLDPLFSGSATTSVHAVSSVERMATSGDLLFVEYLWPSSAGRSLLVYSFAAGAWTVWSASVPSVTAGAVAVASISNIYSLFVSAAGTNSCVIYRQVVGATTDAGAAFPWAYQTGFIDFGTPEAKKVKQVRLFGSGTPTVSLLTNYATTDPLSRQGAVTLGTSPAIAEGRHQKAYQGALVSCRLSGTGPTQVNRIVMDLDGFRAPGATT